MGIKVKISSSSKKSKAISKAAKEVWQEKHHNEFPIDVFQTGSVTATLISNGTIHEVGQALQGEFNLTAVFRFGIKIFAMY